MSGTKFLLDTNFILGLLKSQPAVLAEASVRKLSVTECSYSAVTRMELLGFPGTSRDEEAPIRKKLGRRRDLPLTRAIEEVVISLSQTPAIQLPDADIAATDICEGVDTLTVDKTTTVHRAAKLDFIVISTSLPNAAFRCLPGRFSIEGQEVFILNS